jgi:uncharacterized protein YbjT (DUF2867 family)
MDSPVIVITGATGKTGRIVIEELARRGDVRVRAAVRNKEKARRLLPEVEIVDFDYARPETAKAAMRGARRLYLVTPGGSEQVEQTWVAVEAAREEGVEHIVRLGSLLNSGGPLITVERWALMTERMIERSGVAFTFLRPSWFNQNFTEYIFSPLIPVGLILAPIGEGMAGWIDCRDIAAVAVAALTQPGHEGKAYSLTGPELIGMREILGHLSRAAGRTIRYVNTPEGLQRVLARMAGFPPRDVGAMMELLGKLRDGYLTAVTDDVERVTGRPAISFSRFADDYSAELRRLARRPAA